MDLGFDVHAGSLCQHVLQHGVHAPGNAGLDGLVTGRGLGRELLSLCVGHFHDGDGLAVLPVIGERGKGVGQHQRRHLDRPQQIAKLMHVDLRVIQAAVDADGVHHLLDAAEVQLGGLRESRGVDGVVQPVVDTHFAVVAGVVVLQVVRRAAILFPRVVRTEHLAAAGFPLEIQGIGPPGGIHGVSQGLAFVQPLRQGERLHGGPGLEPTGAVQVIAVGVLGIDIEVQLSIEFSVLGEKHGVLGHRQDLSRPRPDGNQRCAPLVRVGPGRRVNLCLRGLLEPAVQRGGDGQTAAEQLFHPGSEVDAVCRVIEDQVRYVVAKVRGNFRAGAPLFAWLGVKVDPGGGGGVVLRLGDPAEVEHRVEDVVAPLDRVVGIDGGIVKAGAFYQSGEEGGLRQGQVPGCAAEEMAGRGFNAVGIPAEEHDVEIALKDLVLGVLLFQFEGEPHLAHLIADSLLPVEDDPVAFVRRHQGVVENVRDILLGQG